MLSEVLKLPDQALGKYRIYSDSQIKMEHTHSAMKTLAKWSVDDYHRMVEAGILCDRRVELLAGDIVEMSSVTPLTFRIFRYPSNGF